MAIQRTVPGTYQAPVEGIVDYGAFGRGLEKGIAPGLKFLEEQDLEAKKKEKQRKARAAGIQEFGVAGGELFGNTFNADKIIQEDYRAEAQRIRSLLLDPNTTDQDKKLLERQWENLSATNASVQLLVDIDNDSEVYSQEASNLNDLFVSQGSSIDEFRNAYNKGDARPVVRIIDGISVGGFEITAEDGSKKFLDFQYKINQNTINGNVELRSDKRLQTAATGFGKAQGATVKETDQWVNAGEDTIGSTKRTRLLKQSIDSKISEAETSAAEYVAQNPELMPGLYADLAIDKKFLTEEEKQFISLHGIKYNRFKQEGLSAVMAEIAKENPELTPKQLEQRANTEINNTRDNLLQKYIKNEFLKNTSDFYTQKEDKVMSDGSFRKAGLVYPQDDIFETSQKQAPKEREGLSINFGGKTLDNDLLKRTRQLLDITSIQTNSEGQVNQASRDNVVAYVQGQDLNFETKKKGTEELISGKIDGVTSDMITVTSRKITTGADAGQTKAIISIQPKPQVIGNENVEFEPIQYDLTQAGDVEKLLANQYGFATDKGKKFKAQYDPVLSYLKSLRKGTINEDGTITEKPSLP